jgi:chromosomal replication initiator protein
MEHIATNVKSDVRQLQSCLYTLNANHDLLGREITLAMAEEVVQTVSGEEAGLILNKVVKVVCGAYELSEEELRSKCRRKALNEARSLGMYLAKSLTSHTLTEIGAAFGRNHSTATYSINKTERALAGDQRLRLKVEHLVRELDKASRKAV